MEVSGNFDSGNTHVMEVELSREHKRTMLVCAILQGKSVLPDFGTADIKAAVTYADYALDFMDKDK